ncbi:MAG: chalcone isomerase family protein [Proteobacteria bacterium]|nr:chalcone isomerase family protein [Burkholderiales bacterium]
MTGRRALLRLAGAFAANVTVTAAAWAVISGGVSSRSALAAGPPAAGKLPPGVVAVAGDLKRLGTATMRWFGLPLYDASLWVRGAQWDADDNYALEMVYAREFTGKALAESSITEMKRVGFTDEAEHARWLAAMVRLFPNVSRGYRLIGVHLKGGGASFFGQDRPLGTIDDPQFGNAFFSIWLDPRTREPQLRARLLGKS